MVTRPAAVALLLAAAVAAQATPTIQQGRGLLNKGDFAGAEAVFRQVTKANPQSAWGWYFLGYTLHAQKKLDEALAAHEKAAQFPQAAASALYNAACVHALKGDADNAFDSLERAKKAGFQTWGTIRKDKELASLRGDPRFQTLIPPLLKGRELFTEKPRILHTWSGEAAGDQFGWVARRVGDIDKDGVLDFATSAPTWGRGAGRVYVNSGKSGVLLFRRDGKPGETLGNGVGRCGDVNGDGTPDVIVGAPGASRAYVFSGAGGEVLHTFASGEAQDSFGIKVAGAGDLDGDGTGDLIVGAMRADGPKGKDAGRCYVYAGATGKLLFTLDGERAGDQFGSAVDATLTGAQRLLAVGAMNAGPGKKGRAYVYKVAGGKPERFFTIEADATGANLGQYFVSILGDVDADGVLDVFASDFANSANGPHTGRVYVHSGKDGRRLLTLTGKRGEGFGTSVSQAGDVDGDGHADLIVGAWQNREAAVSAGKCYLHSGKDGKLLATFTCRQAQDTFGFDAQGLGDVDGDGAIDFLLTSAWSQVEGPQTGRVFVVAGSIGAKSRD